MQLLARETMQRRHLTRPLVAMYDGPLLGFIMGKDVPKANELTNSYHEAIAVLHDVRAGLVGYVDRPKSTFVVGTIYLMGLDDNRITRTNLQTAGHLEG